MTPAEYESRCAEMLRTNAHNMTPNEIECFAWGAGGRIAVQMAEAFEDAAAQLTMDEMCDDA